MPIRLTALPPGAFMREHLLAVGGVDYVQSVYKSYKIHLVAAGIKTRASRQSFSKYIWLAHKMGLVVFDHAEAISRWDGIEDGFEPLPGYVRESRPQAPSPRHYYRIVNPRDSRWENLEASYREEMGLPRVVPHKPPLAVIAPPVIEVPVPKKKRKHRAAAPPVPLVEAVPTAAPGLPAPEVIPVAPPAVVLERKPRVKAVAPAVPLITAYENRYNEVRALAAVLVANPAMAAVLSLEGKINTLLEDVRAAQRKARGAARTRYGDIMSRLIHGSEDLDTFKSSLIAVERATLEWAELRKRDPRVEMPETLYSAQRALKSIKQILLENMPALSED